MEVTGTKGADIIEMYGGQGINTIIYNLTGGNDFVNDCLALASI